MDLRRCTQCGEEKLLSEFRLGGRKPNGKRYHLSDCNDCHRTSSRAYRAAHLDERRAKELEYARAHTDQKRETARAWYYANKERVLAQRATTYAKDPEPVRDRAHMGRARKAGSSTVEYVRRRNVYERDEGICHVCGRHVPFEDFDMDHVVPLAAGGAHTYANVKVSHSRCNRSRPKKGHPQ